MVLLCRSCHQRQHPDIKLSPPINLADVIKYLKNEILCKEGSLSGAGSDDTPLSTGGTGLKNQSKETSFNNSNINNNNKNKINTNFISFINEKINNNKKTNNKNDDKSVLSKKRKQRIHNKLTCRKLSRTM